MTEQELPQDPFEVPEGYAGDIGDPLETEGVRLPFLAPYLWWVNGINQYKQEGGPRFFGGWAMNDADMDAVIQETGGTAPAGWASYEMVNDNGESYTAYLTRFIHIAVLGSRFRWDTEKNRGQYQVLGYLAYSLDKKLIPFAPVVLTTKATAGMFLRQSVIEFNTKTQGPRRQFANKLPISAFYAAIGTFGDQRVETEVGKGQKKKVTPMRLWLPQKMDEDYLKAVFVGKEIAARTADLRKDAREWLDAWKQTEPVQANGSNSNQRAARPQADWAVPEPPPEPPIDEEMPY